MKRIDACKGRITQRSGLFSRHLANYGTSHICVRCGIARQLARLGRESSPLGKGCCIRTRLLPQFGDRSRSNPAGVGTSESHAAPCVIVVQGRKLRDAAAYPANIGAFNKPQTSPQTLVEDVAAMFGKTNSGKI